MSIRRPMMGLVLLTVLVSASSAYAVGICFLPSPYGNNVTLNCDMVGPWAFPNAYVGFAIDSAPCKGERCYNPVGEDGGEQYLWSISSSAADAYQNSGPVPAGPVTLYLWLACSPTYGMSAAEFSLQTDDPSFVLTALTPMNGVLNAGSAADPLLAVGGCPTGAFLAASLTLERQPTATEPDTWGGIKALYR
ncbi:MAG: hypothetical protein DHS20C21_15870 [Gemmatimonadota bacterium]|nr:MAG: hypothetical protein DHS20C21_15870 [Gemmatimonadota bacterium]